jgi:hypothetical protein
VHRAALGIRSHSGWAVVVTATTSHILDRCRIEIADPAIPGSRQPFHAAEGLPFDQAETLIRKCRESSLALATAAVGALKDNVERAAILFASGRPLPDLAAILRSHALIHAAEGEFFREILASACEQCGLQVLRIKERDLPDNPLIVELGRSLGPPWRQDEKRASLAAWAALKTVSTGQGHTRG